MRKKHHPSSQDYNEQMITELEKRFDICRKRIRDNQRNIRSFDDWAVENELMGKGFLKNNRDKIKPRFRQLKSDLQKGIEDRKALNWLENKVEKLEIHIEAWLKAHNVSTIEAKNYYGYFLYHQEMEDEPEFARVTISVTDTGFTTLKNVDDGTSHHYEGQCKFVSNNALFFELFSTEEIEVKQRKTSIKVYQNRPRADEFLVGGYITFENNSIIRGSIVLVVNEKEKPKPAIISYKQNSKELESIPDPIRYYLAHTAHNYYKSEHLVFKEEHLQKLMDKKCDLLENKYRARWMARFAEINEQPRIHISAPILSSASKSDFIQNRKLVNKIGERLKTEFHGKLEMHLEEMEPLKEKDMSNVPPSLTPLKRTRIFILFYTHHDRGSFSLVQLGWACVHCKSVIVAYKDGSLSSHVKRLKNIGVDFIKFTDLEKDFDDVSEQIEAIVKKNLSGYLAYINKSSTKSKP